MVGLLDGFDGREYIVSRCIVLLFASCSYQPTRPGGIVTLEGTYNSVVKSVALLYFVTMRYDGKIIHFTFSDVMHTW